VVVDRRRVDGNDISLKAALAKRSSANDGRIVLSEADIGWLSGVRDAFGRVIDGNDDHDRAVESLIRAIEEFGAIEVWLE